MLKVSNFVCEAVSFCGDIELCLMDEGKDSFVRFGIVIRLNRPANSCFILVFKYHMG